MIGEFKHRLQSSIVDTLRISGDIVLYQLSMSYAWGIDELRHILKRHIIIIKVKDNNKK